MLTSSQRVTNWRRSVKIRMVEAMGNECQICKYSKCKAALEFHHVDPSEKEISFGQIKILDSLLNELEKCILLCSNCHREIHAGITSMPNEYSKLDRSFFSKSPTNGKAVLTHHHTDYCPICSTSKSTNLSYCSPLCFAKARRKIDWDSINLIDLVEIQKIPMTTLGLRFGVSDNAVRKQYRRQKS